VWLRAQRSAKGNGRLYRIQYTAGNEKGSCRGVAYACVPLQPLNIKGLPAVTTTPALDGPDMQAAVAEKAPAKSACPEPSSISEEQWMPTQQEEPEPGLTCAKEAPSVAVKTGSSRIVGGP
jgi:hypothetical protein